MSSAPIATMVKMMETLPEESQEQVAEHLREYIAEVQDENQWEATFKKTQAQLIAAARQAKKEIAAGRAEPMDYGKL
jgi:hypothetical protein